MEYVAFGDESGTSSHDKCYSIGLLCISKHDLLSFNSKIEFLKKKNGIVGELKWTKIKNSSGQVNMCLDIIKLLLKKSYIFHSIVVTKDQYRKWSGNKEEAFYVTYTFLIKNAASRIGFPISVVIDYRADKYKKNEETVAVIANHMLSKEKESRKIRNVKMYDSKLHLGLQAVDIVTGIVNTGYSRYLGTTKSLSWAKREVLKRSAHLLGWDDMIYDTYPNKCFNIWHFPEETRALPATKEIKPSFIP